MCVGVLLYDLYGLCMIQKTKYDPHFRLCLSQTVKKRIERTSGREERGDILCVCECVCEGVFCGFG